MRTPLNQASSSDGISVRINVIGMPANSLGTKIFSRYHPNPWWDTPCSCQDKPELRIFQRESSNPSAYHFSFTPWSSGSVVKRQSPLRLMASRWLFQESSEKGVPATLMSAIHTVVSFPAEATRNPRPATLAKLLR